MKLNQNDSLTPYIDMNTYLSKKSIDYFKKYFFKLISNALFGKYSGKCEKS